MPEFILDHGDAKSARRFKALDAFTQGYIEAMFFTSINEEDLQHANVSELAPVAWAGIARECNEWQYAWATSLALAYQQDGYDEEAAGRDYWYTRNGHGVGFWTRDQLTKIVVGKRNETNLGDVLSERARVMGERSIYRGDDGLIYYGQG